MGELLHPSLVVLVGAAVVGLLPRRLASVGAVVAAVLGLGSVLTLDRGDVTTMGFYGFDLTPLRADGLSLAFAVAFAAVTVLAAIYGLRVTGRLEQVAGLVAAAAGMGVVLAGDLVSLFFWWELKVVATTLLIVAARRPASLAAGWRYFLVHLVGGAILLGGIAWMGVERGDLSFGTLLVDGRVDGPATLVLLGVLLSAAAPPLGAWLPDAYPRSTVVGTVLLSAFTTKSAVYALARGFPGLEVLVWLGAGMALFGVTYAVLEHDVRRLLSYHIVSQVGFMVAAVGVGGAAGVNGATAHAITHLLYKALLLMAVGAVLYVTGRSSTTQLGGLARAMPWVVGCYLVGALSISGMPLLAGFPAKALSTGAVGDVGPVAADWMLKVAAVGTFLSVALKLPALTWFGQARGEQPTRRVPLPMLLAMGAAAAANVILGVAPSLLHGLLPFDVVKGPYSAGYVVEAVHLAAFTTIGYWLLRARLAPHARTSIDADWLYRELPARLRTRSWPPLPQPAAALRPLLATVTRCTRQASERASALRGSAGLVLGGTVAVTCVVLLAASVLA